MPDKSRTPGVTDAFRGFVAALAVMLVGRVAGRRPTGAPAPALPSPAPPRRVSFRQIAKVAGLVVLAEIVLAPVAAALFIWSGVYNVAATSPHLDVTHEVLHRAMIQSVKRHAKDLTPPSLDDDRLIRRGAAHYETGCAPCHGSPLTPPSPIEIGATPPPPPLYSAASDFKPDQLHWVVKHGIKMTAMPPWPAQNRDDEVWAMVAFLEKLRGLKPGEYGDMIGRNEHAPKQNEPALQALSDSGDSRSEGCAACHGADGAGRDGVAPRLAGLSAAYIKAQLDAFHSGERPSGIMRPVAMGLSPEKADALAEHFASLPRISPTPNVPAELLARGEQIATRNGAAPCDSCHSSAGGAHDPLVPILDGQDRDYLVAQLRLFAGRVRNGPGALSMQSIARKLDPQDALAVATYYASRKDDAAAGLAAR